MEPQSQRLQSHRIPPTSQHQRMQALIHGLNRHYYSIVIDYRKNELEEQVSRVLSGSGRPALPFLGNPRKSNHADVFSVVS